MYMYIRHRLPLHAIHRRDLDFYDQFSFSEIALGSSKKLLSYTTH